jgi:hypothetical protein
MLTEFLRYLQDTDHSVTAHAFRLVVAHAMLK